MVSVCNVCLSSSGVGVRLRVEISAAILVAVCVWRIWFSHNSFSSDQFPTEKDHFSIKSPRVIRHEHRPSINENQLLLRKMRNKM